jgi:paraquat-inducible protein A
LHQRKTNSLTRTWALTIAAFIFYIPANVLPITVVTSLGKTQADTIMSGVIYFMLTGMWPIALVIFVASVAVPLIKLFVLTFLLISVQLRFSGNRDGDQKIEPASIALPRLLVAGPWWIFSWLLFWLLW